MTKNTKTHHVLLNANQRQYLWLLIESGVLSDMEKNRAQALLHADESPLGPGLPDIEIAKMLGLHRMTVVGLRYRFAKLGLALALGITTTTQKRLDRKWEAENLARDGWQLIDEAAKKAGYNAEHVRQLVRLGLLSNVKRVKRKLYISSVELEAHRASVARNNPPKDAGRNVNNSL